VQFDRSFSSVAALRELGLPVLGSVSRIAFPAGRRRERIQIVAIAACATILLAGYGTLLLLSINLYQLSII
jgi:hypothetical protein